MSHFIFFLVIFFITIFNVFLYYSLFKTNKYFSITDDYKRNNIVNAAGIIIVIQTLIFLIYLINFSEYSNFINKSVPRPNFFLISILALCIISFLDDIFKEVDFRIRLFVQTSVIFISLSLLILNSESSIPIKLQQYTIIILWVYILNFSNFIDGLDGFLLIHSINVFLIVLIKFFVDQNLLTSTLLSSFLLPCSLAIAFFNFPKAKIFLGDTGSIFYGFVIGFIFFELVLNKNYFVAASIIMYPFLDVTLTLINKILNKKMPWDRDFDYFFLKPVIKNKLPHTSVTIPFLFFNFFLLLNNYLYFLFNNKILILLNLLMTLYLLFYFQKKK